MINMIDIKDMPNFNPKVRDNIDSVFSGRVFIKKLVIGEYPWCVKHGAMNKVSREGIWRCIMCGDGCYEIG